MIGDRKYTEVTAAAQATDEIQEIADDVIEGWYNDGPIDWADVWDRMDGTRLDDGTYLDLGTQSDSPAMRKIQRKVRADRTAG